MTKKYPWRTGRSCQFKLFYHLVFVSKYRRGVFNVPILNRLQAILTETCIQLDAELLAFNGEDDHVHLRVSCPPKLAIANLVSKLKGKSSYFLRKEYGAILQKKLWGKHLWTPSYCVVSCGGAPLSVVKQYINEQRRPPSEQSVAQSIRNAKHHD